MIYLIVYCLIGAFIALWFDVQFVLDGERNTLYETLMKFAIIFLWVPIIIYLFIFAERV